MKIKCYCFKEEHRHSYILLTVSFENCSRFYSLEFQLGGTCTGRTQHKGARRLRRGPAYRWKEWQGILSRFSGLSKLGQHYFYFSKLSRRAQQCGHTSPPLGWQFFAELLKIHDTLFKTKQGQQNTVILPNFPIRFQMKLPEYPDTHKIFILASHSLPFPLHSKIVQINYQYTYLFWLISFPTHQIKRFLCKGF